MFVLLNSNYLNGLLFAGTDNHHSKEREDKHKFGGMESERPIEDEQDFVKAVLSGEMKYFVLEI